MCARVLVSNEQSMRRRTASFFDHLLQTVRVWARQDKSDEKITPSNFMEKTYWMHVLPM